MIRISPFATTVGGILETGALVPPCAVSLKAAISGIRLAAHIGGLLVEKLEVGRLGVFEQMTDAELGIALLGECRALGLSERSLAEPSEDDRTRLIRRGDGTKR